MFIKSLTLDGFKSYPHRTVIDDFDRSFNAITGLNGSGKSNVLDALCFVLGLSSLSRVRASNLRQLIYMQGQAGVTRASVTVVFDNSDESKSPIGYTKTPFITVARTIYVDGRCTYQIGGRNVTQKAVHTLFRSVQLDITNPHFLIQQGRVAHVVSMAPAELRGMVEEAAGTRMFDAEAAAARRTIAQKDPKIAEIDAILADRIRPVLERLDSDAQAFREWADADAERAKLLRIATAKQYVDTRRAAVDQPQVAAADAAVATSAAAQEHAQRVYDNAAAELAAVESAAQADVEQRDALRQTRAAMDAAQVEYDAAVAAAAAIKAAAADAESARRQTEADINTVRKQLADIGGSQSVTEAAAAKARLTAASQRLAALRSGGASGSLGDLARAARTEARTKVDEAAAADRAVEGLARRREGLRAAWASAQQESLSAAEAKFAEVRERVAAAKTEAAVTAAAIERADVSAGRSAAAQAQAALSTAEQEHRAAAAAVTRAASIRFTRPAADLFRGLGPEAAGWSVLGRTFEFLVPVDHALSAALSAAARAARHIVVSHKAAIARLINSRAVATRESYVSVDNLRGGGWSAGDAAQLRRLLQAGGITGGVDADAAGWAAAPAAELVRAARPELDGLRSLVFGKTVVCRTQAVAKAVAFGSGRGFRAVTLDGDLYDPSGVLSGGSRGQQGPGYFALTAVLADTKAKLTAVQTALTKAQAEAQAAAAASAAAAAAAAAVRDLEQQAAAMERAINAVRDLEGLDAEEAAATAAATAARAAAAAATEAAEAAAAQAQTAASDRGAALSAAAADVDAATAAATAAEAAAAAATAKARDLRARLEVLEEDLAGASAAAAEDADFAERADAAEARLVAAAAARAEASSAHEAVAAAAAAAAEALSAAEMQAGARRSALATAEHAVEHAKAAFSAAQSDAVAAREAATAAADALLKLVDEHPWLEEQAATFGRPGGEFDFAAFDMGALDTTLDRLSARIAALERRVNRRALAQAGAVRAEWADLTAKRQQLSDDRETIENVIASVERRKRGAVMAAHARVSADLGAIFSTLLPGSDAELVPTDGEDVMGGLSFRVKLSGVWKDGLTELSGGQRSLLALSLTLALLRFHPAPVYILDEVDAALDVSHTQNIGRLIAERFPNAQFIVVSLRDGMFASANALFRTKFVDGASSVQKVSHRRH